MSRVERGKKSILRYSDLKKNPPAFEVIKLVELKKNGKKKNEKKTSKRGTIRSLAELSLHRRLQPRPICLPFCDDPS